MGVFATVATDVSWSGTAKPCAMAPLVMVAVNPCGALSEPSLVTTAIGWLVLFDRCERHGAGRDQCAAHLELRRSDGCVLRVSWYSNANRAEERGGCRKQSLHVVSFLFTYELLRRF